MAPQQGIIQLLNITLTGTLSPALTLVLFDAQDNTVSPRVPFSVSLSICHRNDPTLVQTPTLTCAHAYDWTGDKLTFSILTVNLPSPPLPSPPLSSPPLPSLPSRPSSPRLSSHSLILII